MRAFAPIAALVPALAAGLAVFAVPAPASANWEKTRWGMTPAEVKAAYPGAAEVPPTGERTWPILELNQPVVVPFITWSKVQFLFERGGRLTAVILTPAEADPREHLTTYMIFNFGAPVEMSGSRDQAGRSVAGYRTEYVDRKSGDEITWTEATFLDVKFTSVEHRQPDPAETARRAAARRVRLLRDRGEIPLPPGGWNNTRWTMSREQVLALYPSVRQDELGRLSIEGPFTWQGRAWEQVAFEFDPDYGLEGVFLWTSRADLAALEAEARAAWGAPVKVYGKPDDAEISFYGLSFPPTAAGEFVELFSSRLRSDQGTGLHIIAPDDSAAERAAMAGRDPGPEPLSLHWEMSMAEFKALFPAAADTAPDIQFVTLSPVSLYGRTWKRGLFHFTYGGLAEFTLFSNDSYAAILASMTSLYGPPQVHLIGSLTENQWEDNVTRSRFRLKPVFDGTAILSVEQKLG